PWLRYAPTNVAAHEAAEDSRRRGRATSTARDRVPGGEDVRPAPPRSRATRTPRGRFPEESGERAKVRDDVRGRLSPRRIGHVRRALLPALLEEFLPRAGDREAVLVEQLLDVAQHVDVALLAHP